MLSLIEQIKTGRLWDFPGGVHPPENKRQSNQAHPVEASLPSQLVLPLKQHIGKSGDLSVSVGDKVLKGQTLTHYTSSFMLPIHAPTSGVISAIEKRTISHPSGLEDLCIVLEPDGEDRWIERQCTTNFQLHSPESLIEEIRDAGISGLGGAGFPTAKKIQSGIARTEILIINGAECEPYITADDVLMQHYAQEIVTGIEVVKHILQPELVLIAIEDNKPQAVEAMAKAAADKDYVIRVIPTKYPSGGEKQLIKVLTNKEVPNGRLPADIGVVVQNVGSLFAIKRAIIDNEPLIQRLVTLTGNCFQEQRNVWAKLGTPVSALLEEFNYQEDKRHPRLIMGGPMMGFTLPHANVPITKTSNCILAPKSNELATDSVEMACIRCGQCAEVCPASLLPQQLLWHAKAQEHQKCEELHLKDCIECGACAYVCPSEIPLVQYYRQAKAEINTQKREAQASERAKQRFEEKKARLERDKAERENRFKKAADARRSEMKQQSGGDDAIAAAIARVKAQKESSSSPADTPVKPAVAAAIAKAKAKQQAALKAGEAEPNNQEMIRLREERKQLARQRKAAQQAQSQPDQDDTVNIDTTEPTAEVDPKKAAVAAAIARAKARKAE
ncbi:electron transport complex subunit RsxC, partial [Vibrio sp. WJH972]